MARRLAVLLGVAAVLSIAGGCRGGVRSGRWSLIIDPLEKFDPSAPWVPRPGTTPVLPKLATPGAVPPRPGTAPRPSTGSSTAPAPAVSARPLPTPGPTLPPAPLTAVPVEGSTPIFVDDREVGRLTRADFAAFNAAWAQFVAKDRLWPASRDAWVARGGAAPFVLAENLFRYFLSATAWGQRSDIYRIAESARACGEAAVGYFGNLLIRDTWPLKEPITARQSDGTTKTFKEWTNDDVTRQHLTIILASIGEPAVARLSSEPYIRSPLASARHYVLAALGRIGSDAAVDVVASMLSSSDWQDRGYAAKALGFALNFKKNVRARAPLERALADPDEFVRKKAKEGLDGKTKSEF